MCRMLVVRADRPMRLTGSLLTAEHSLVTQSCCDAEEKACHQDGWGIGYYDDSGMRRIRSTKGAAADPDYRHLAETTAATTLVAHVRRASSGSVAFHNSHPFTYGQWMFAHNGNLGGFGRGREPLLERIPAHLRGKIEGQTDSEHAFFYVLGDLENAIGSLDAGPEPRKAAQSFADSIRSLARLFPGDEKEPSQFNFLLTDGRMVLASRWGHSLSWLRRRGPSPDGLDQPLDDASATHAIVIASEPTSSEAWTELPERSILLVTPDLETQIFSLASEAPGDA